MYSEKTKIAIIGCGWISNRAHIPSFLKLPHVEICTLFDINTQLAVETATRFRINHVSKNLADVWKSEATAVVITTPNHTHYHISREAIFHGKHVLCEKPITIRTSEMNEIKRLVKERNVFFMPAFVNRFRKDVGVFLSEITKGEMGSPRSIDAGWLRKDGVPRPGTWITNKEKAGGGVLIDLGPHILDLCCLFLNQPNFEIASLKTASEIQGNVTGASWFERNDKETAVTDVESSAVIALKSKNEISAKIQLDWSADIKFDTTYFHINFENGQASLKTLFGFSSNRSSEGACLSFNFNDGRQSIRTIDNGIDAAEHAFDQLIANFVDQVVYRQSRSINEMEAFDSVDLIERLYESVIVHE